MNFNEKDLKMWLIGFLTKYGMSEQSKEENAEKLNKDSDQILTFIKQYFDLKEKEKKDYNEHLAQPAEIKLPEKE